MRKIESVDELKQIQLDILLAFDKFCVENDIKYSLAAGSLIGAIRHKGFIPWDDDIDVYVMRKDYKKLVGIFPEKYIGKYTLITMERNKKWNRAYGKLCDDRTVYCEDANGISMEMGVAIDVFPIDDVPDDFAEWTKYNKRRKLLRNMYTLKFIRINKGRSLVKNLFAIVSKVVLFPFSFKLLARIMNWYSQIHNGKGYKHVYENCPGVYNTKNAWLKKDFAQVYYTEFEGCQVKIMVGYDDYLRTIYGDYMKLPPEEKRVSHHIFDAYWK